MLICYCACAKIATFPLLVKSDATLGFSTPDFILKEENMAIFDDNDGHFADSVNVCTEFGFLEYPKFYLSYPPPPKGTSLHDFTCYELVCVKICLRVSPVNESKKKRLNKEGRKNIRFHPLAQKLSLSGSICTKFG